MRVHVEPCENDLTDLEKCYLVGYSVPVVQGLVSIKISKGLVDLASVLAIIELHGFTHFIQDTTLVVSDTFQNSFRNIVNIPKYSIESCSEE